MSISLQKLRGKQLHKAKAVDVELQKKSSILNPFVQKVMLNWMSGLIMWVLPRIPISIHDVHLHIEVRGCYRMADSIFSVKLCLIQWQDSYLVAAKHSA